MATSGHRAIRDQNSTLLYNGSTPSNKTNFPNADERAAVGGRKALNDISNSRNPSVLQPGKKSNSANVIAVDKESYVAKPKRSRVPEKKVNGGRKPLSDVTNSIEASSHQVQKAVLKSKRVAGENALASILDEGFVHDHEKCIKSETQVLDKVYFFSCVGLHDIGMSPKSSVGSSIKEEHQSDPMTEIKIEPIPELSLDDHPGCASPACKSPKSPPPLGLMNWDDDSASSYLPH